MRDLDLEALYSTVEMNRRSVIIGTPSYTVVITITLDRDMYGPTSAGGFRSGIVFTYGLTKIEII
ncbi:hypothetical protein MYVALT_G_02800 [Candidatus Vallotia tarda]|uniref:Uncharacterized protein n=2 Tax=Candidatus Vallotiella hemipterorum TaxID=1177213 RepID=A0A916NLB8_9BURK|nr:hypothetical protein MYVALT_G_02800 [Candidatus Vallotia tarda]